MKLGEIIASVIIIALTIIIVSFIGIHLYSNEGCGCISVKANTHRAGSDSIQIKYDGGQDADQVMANNSFIIQVNGKNATNMDAIRQSGLNATLDPATGLENKVGSTVTITGSDMSDKTHVVVIACYKDRTQQVILDTYE